MKKNYVLSINPGDYGLNYHDPSVALFDENGLIVAIEEERLNNIKGSKGIFPKNAVRECLKYAKIDLNDVDKVSIGYLPELWKNRMSLEMEDILKRASKLDADEKQKNKFILDNIIESNLLKRYEFFRDKDVVKNHIRKRLECDREINIEFYEHHLSHIASSYLVSGFKEATGVVIDGVGESSATTVWKIVDNKFEKILDIPIPNSLGYFYAVATAFLGFVPWMHEGKLMALAPYGEYDAELFEKLKNVINIENDVYDVSNFVANNMTNYLMMDIDKAVKNLELITNIKARGKNDPITQEHKNFAYAIQNLLENSIKNLVNYAISLTGISNVCVAGGVFMNCKMNMVIREQSNAMNYFVQPVAGDAGLIIGSGLLATENRINNFNSLSVGLKFSDEEIEYALKEKNLNYIRSEDVAKDTAILLSNEKIVCWFQERLEMGCRALGNRSILANPGKIETSRYLNEKIKHREPWRPFACSILEDKANDVLANYKIGNKYPFMIEAFKVNETWKEKIPAVIHCADGTTRPQTVNSNDYKLYYDMIDHFYKITGMPLVLNTSFNDKGQPIILKPQEAIEFFLKNPVDALAIGNFIVIK